MTHYTQGLDHELTPACPHCDSTNVSAMGSGNYSCNSCDTHIDAFTWKAKAEELIQ
jgi:ribosomal protein L37AE/L43A